MYYFVSILTNVGPIHFPVCAGREVDLPLAVEAVGRRRGVFYDVADVRAVELSEEEYREIAS